MFKSTNLFFISFFGMSATCHCKLSFHLILRGDLCPQCPRNTLHQGLHESIHSSIYSSHALTHRYACPSASIWMQAGLSILWPWIAMKVAQHKIKNFLKTPRFCSFCWDRISCNTGWPQNHCVFEDDLEPLIFWPLLSKCWDYRYIWSHTHHLCGTWDWTQSFLYAK